MPKYLSCVALASLMVATAPFVSPAEADGFSSRGYGSLKDAPSYTPYSWTGFYFGGNIGGARLDAEVDVTPDDGFDGDDFFFDPDEVGLIGGLSTGYNFQFGRYWLAGIEGDWTWSDLSDRVAVPFDFDGVTGVAHASLGIDWLASLRARLGLVNDRALFYVTGGVAWADVNLNGDVDDDDGVFDFEASDGSTETGWVVGGGIEYAVTNNFILGGEYLYYQFDSASVSSFDDGDGVYTYVHDDLQVNSFRATAKYKF